MGFVDTLLYHARVEPERPAIVLVDRVVTYGMLARVLRAIETRIAQAGVAKGDLVGIDGARRVDGEHEFEIDLGAGSGRVCRRGREPDE